jgi:hypothetical protein
MAVPVAKFETFYEDGADRARKGTGPDLFTRR